MKGNRKSRNRQIADGEYDPFRHLRVSENDLLCIEYWNIDAVIPVLIAPRFRAFVEGVEGCGATPGAFYDIDEDGDFTRREGWEAWHRVLKKMQYAFDTMEKNTYGVHGSVTDGLTAAQTKDVEEGLLLFAKNYFNLWY